MGDKEKVAWLAILVVPWIVFGLVVALAVWSPTPRAVGQLPVLVGLGPGFTVGYLMVLSWRVAYLAGRKK